MTAAARVVDVRSTTPSVSLENERNRTTRSIRRGNDASRSDLGILWPTPTADRSTRYVEMLEQQQAQLVAGLQELYVRSLKADVWDGAGLAEVGSGQPLTHDILAHLGVLQQDRHGSTDPFEENFLALQQRLYERGAPPMLRHRSTSSGSESRAHSRLNSVSSRPTLTPPTPPSTGPLLSPSAVEAYFGSPPPPPPSAPPADEPAIGMPLSDLDRQAWSSTTFLDDSMDFLQKYQTATEPDGAEASSRGPDGAASGACLGSEWNDDEDFRAFFNRIVA